MISLLAARCAPLVCALIAAFCGAGFAQPADTTILRLDALLSDVGAANPNLEAARLEAAALATRRRQVSALPDPMVEFGYRPFAIDGVDGSFPARIAIRQMMPYPGKRALAGKAASRGAEMAAHTSGELALELAYQVKESYYELFRIQEQERLIRLFQAQIESFERAAAARYEVGSGPQQAVLKAQLEKHALARRLLELATIRRMHLERLARLVNRPDLSAGDGRLLVERPALGVAKEIALDEALDARPEVRALVAGSKMADAEVALARKNYLPDFSVGAGLMDMMSRQALRPLDDLSSRFALEIGVIVPLQRGRREAALEEARLRRSQFEARLEAARLQIRTETRELENRLLDDEEALALYSRVLVPQAETTLESTLSAYTTGRADFLDLLDSQRMLFDLHMDYEETYVDFVRTRAQLERTLGVESLQPDALPSNYDADASAQDQKRQ